MSKFSWFIAGIGVGTVAGILYAPTAGSETREQLIIKTNEAREKSTALAKQAVHAAGDYVQLGKETAGQYLAQGKSLANDHLAQASAALSAVKEAYAKDAPQGRPSEEASDLESSSPVTSA